MNRILICAAVLGVACTRDESATVDSAAPVSTVDSMPPVQGAPAGPGVANAVVDSALTEPQLVLHGDSYRLHLPPPMHRAILAKGNVEIPLESDYLPAVRQFASDVGPRQALFAVVGDFDGDRRDDVAVHTRVRRAADSSQMILAVLNDSAGPRVIEIDRYPLYSGLLGEYLLYQKAETLRSPHEKAAVNLTADAFQVVFFEKAAKLYYYRNGRFNRYFTAD
jgi:hypothetical protein